MALAPLFGLGLHSGKTPAVTAALLQNFYCEFRPENEKTRIVAIGTPGLDLFGDFGDTDCRGGIPVEQNDLLYLVHRGTFWEVTNAGVKTSRGTLNTQTNPVYLAHDGNLVVIVDGTNGYVYNLTTLAFAEITDGAFPDNPTSVTWQDGYFIVGFDSGRFYISTDGLTWDALDFANAESDPDRLIRVFADHGELVMFGDISCEFWGNSGAQDFPYAKLQGANAEWGLGARASVAKFDDSVAFLCKNRMGQVIVAKLAGHRVQKLSSTDLDTIINSYAVTSDATAFSYLLNGHPLYQINFPSAGASWLFDGLTNMWTKLKSYGQTRHRAAFGFQYLSKTVVTDASNGRFYRINPDTFTENGEPIEGEITGEHWDTELQRFTIDKLRLDMQVGQGPAIAGTLSVWDGEGTLFDDGATLWDYQRETPAQVLLQFSRDGGQTWGNEFRRSVGLPGQYMHRIEFRRCGQFRRCTARFRFTDSFRRIVLGAYLNPKG